MHAIAGTENHSKKTVNKDMIRLVIKEFFSKTTSNSGGLPDARDSGRFV